MSDSVTLEKKREKRMFFSKDDVFGSKERINDWSDTQYQTAEALQQTFKNDSVLATVHASTMTPQEMQSAYENKYVSVLNVKKANEGSREMKRVKKQAKEKAKSAIVLQKQLEKQLNDLGDQNDKGNIAKKYQTLINSNMTLRRIQASRDPEHDALKSTAPSILERGLKLTHAMEVLEYEKDNMPELYAYAKEELTRTQNEWQKIEARFMNPVIDEEQEKELLKDREKKEGRGETYAGLDIQYETELDKNLKKRVLFGKNKNYDPGPKMKEVIDKQISDIKKDYPDITEEEIESTVNEYLERMLENAEFHMRAGVNLTGLILQSRSHSREGKDEYNEMIKKMYSNRDDNADCSKIINYAYLGSKYSGGYLARNKYSKSQIDTLDIYGNVAIKLDKKKFLRNGNVSFVVGNSLHHYDEKHGRSAIVDKARNTGPDITCCGKNLARVFKRAHELKQDGWKNMVSPEQEAQMVAKDDMTLRYFEAHFHGNVGPGEIEEITYIVKPKKTSGFSYTNLEGKKEIKNNADIRKLYDHINIINKNPTKYGRKVNDPKLKLTIWDTVGNSISYAELISIMEAPDSMFEEKTK